MFLNNIFVGVNKYLKVSYTCVPDAKEVTVCEGEQTTLKCPASFKTFVNSVFWGRQSVSVCPANNGLSMCTGASESLDMLRKKCDASDKCDITASFDEVQNGAENCPGIQKYLIVNYSCKPAGAKGALGRQSATFIDPFLTEKLSPGVGWTKAG